MSSPCQRSLAHLRKNGWTACVVERFIAPRKIRVDAFGFGDILAMRWFRDIGGVAKELNSEIMLVQTTTGSHFAERRKKINSLQSSADWVMSGGKILLHGWSKQGPRGKRKTWTLKEEWL